MRSPNYPSLSLPDAIEHSHKLWGSKGRQVMTDDEAAIVFGHQNAKSGPARRKISALKQYGLIEKDAGGWKLSDRAIAILHKPEVNPARKTAITEAVEGVVIFKELLLTHRSASEGVIKAFLLTDREFTDSGAAGFIKSFIPTKNLVDAKGNGYNGSDADDPDQAGDAPLKVGDKVQWVSEGVDQFAEPREILGLSDDGDYAFVVGSQTGLRIDQLVVQESAMSTPATKTPPANPFAGQSPPPPPRTPSLHAGELPLPLPMPDGTIKVVPIPRMSGATFDFFKGQLEAYKTAIIKRDDQNDDPV